MGLAIAGALLVGLSLGLLGSGGSILTVPVLTYLVGQEEKVAIAGSLAVVATISFFAGLPYARKKMVDVRSVALFGIPGMVGAYGGAWASKYVSGSVQLMAFAVLMLLAAVFMLRGTPTLESARPRRDAWKIVVDGLVVGAITGFVGVGGGFLIVPALVFMGGLTMRRAVGTSLFIIALKSTAGFVKYLDVLAEQGLTLDFSVLAVVAGVGVAGSFAGGALGARLPQAVVRRVFAIGLLAVGTFVTYDSLRSLSGAGDPKPVTDSLQDGASPRLSAIERAEAARNALFSELSGELSSAMQEDGAAAAIDVCSKRAPAIAASVSKAQDLRIGRTSAQLRSQNNVIPEWAREQVLAEDATPQPLLDTTAEGELHALFPILTGELCLTCHGSAESIAPDVLAALVEHYPNDRATGYEAGDLRGWFWVEVENADLR